MGLDYMERRPGPRAHQDQKTTSRKQLSGRINVEKMHPGSRAEVDDFSG